VALIGEGVVVGEFNERPGETSLQPPDFRADLFLQVSSGNLGKAAWRLRKTRRQTGSRAGFAP